MIDQHLTLITDSTLLGMFTSIEIQGFLRQGSFKIITVPRGSLLHLEGELCSKLELIISGKLVVERISDTGDLLPIADFTINDVLGGGLIFSQKPYYPMTVSAQQTSIIVQIPKDVLFALLCNNPCFLQVYLELTSDRTSILADKIKHNLNKPLRERIISFLDHQYRLQQNKRIELSMTKTMLAQKIGVQRTSLSRELKKMQDEGLITFDTYSITILYL